MIVIFLLSLLYQKNAHSVRVLGQPPWRGRFSIWFFAIYDMALEKIKTMIRILQIRMPDIRSVS
ncbi:hypothetical protein A3E96_02370 [Candidatus Uhrbacteria bacterium RIFCSPHIGHO2_12_FULL_46_13]|nr:MAG: hypothetical protein A3E96_02370 [Candidatus Uhrbacteria bacterium RIFCSPHIGHO2_12_FULL_46_13]